MTCPTSSCISAGLHADLAAVHMQTGTTAERIAAFKATVDRCHRRIGDLKAIVGNIFQSVFMARFRDVADDIRAAVISDIGTFISMDPSQYLQDSYLKYLAWAMSDKVSTCNGEPARLRI